MRRSRPPVSPAIVADERRPSRAARRAAPLDRRSPSGVAFPVELEPFLQAFADMIVEDLLGLPPDPER
jgi:hypothetical protein